MKIKEILKRYPESGTYHGINANYNEVTIIREAGNGAQVNILQSNGLKETVNYSEDGNVNSVDFKYT